MSLLSLFGLSALLHLYIGVRIVPALSGPFTPWVLALLLASAVLTPLGLVARRFARPPLADRLTWVGMLAMGMFSSLLVVTVLRDLVLLLAWAAGSAFPELAPADLATTSADAVPLLALAATLLGVFNARKTARIVSVDVPIAGLPAALHGFTIAQISDIHVGPTIKAPYLRGIVDAVNRLQADVVAVTGDLVDGSVAELRGHVAPLADLVSRHGTFFVTGNHEYYSGAASWVAELRRLGVKVLMNQHVVLERGGAEMVLAGIADYSAHHFDPSQKSDPVAALRGAPKDAAVRVLLAHQPRSATAAEQAGFDLQLSGHTHGGQFLPWVFFVRFQQPFTAGLHRLGRLWVYVSRGTGYWGPPKRLGAPSEITRLRLVPA
ncbi:MAG: metallophosphoesterase [Ramlibacter sp.]|jgi:predicted MPP superfamily phosphohydrolase|nr:metallophosphoesterase [Ramlibacter sp.]